MITDVFQAIPYAGGTAAPLGGFLKNVLRDAKRHFG